MIECSEIVVQKVHDTITTIDSVSGLSKTYIKNMKSHPYIKFVPYYRMTDNCVLYYFHLNGRLPTSYYDNNNIYTNIKTSIKNKNDWTLPPQLNIIIHGPDDIQHYEKLKDNYEYEKKFASYLKLQVHENCGNTSYFFNGDAVIKDGVDIFSMFSGDDNIEISPKKSILRHSAEYNFKFNDEEYLTYLMPAIKAWRRIIHFR